MRLPGIAFVTLLLIAVPAAAADAPLTNADVIRLVEAGLSAETVALKIATSSTRFELSTDELVALAKANVPDSVVQAMIRAGGPTEVMPLHAPADPPQAAPAPRPGAEAKPSVGGRRFEVAVHRTRYARCDGAELRVDAKGLRSSRCRDLDFDLQWSEVTAVCHDYGFRGSVTVETASRSHTVSTTTPAEAKKIVDAMKALHPSLPLRGCAR